MVVEDDTANSDQDREEDYNRSLCDTLAIAKPSHFQSNNFIDDLRNDSDKNDYNENGLIKL